MRVLEGLWAVGGAALWGAAVGVLNNRMAASAVARLRSGVDPRSPEGRQAARQVARLYLLRLPVGMGALLVAFLVWREAVPLLATAAGMVAAHGAGVAAELRELRGRGRSREGGDGA